ncbi:hypothetical protein RRG08_067423 [Elysia crispata]|uniref:Uncharacterized protein n=1 Tax=Elysia crispata TaxID=231223 RepID=A0AAE1A2B7_9GAST|nr:hypothetical protein RRG08_067423 [Elysia crispata]
MRKNVLAERITEEEFKNVFINKLASFNCKLVDLPITIPKPWGDPDNFCTERFLDADGNPIKDPPRFIPFGLGKKILSWRCIRPSTDSSSYGCRPWFPNEFPGLRLRTLLEELPRGKVETSKSVVPEECKVKFVPRPV